MTYFELFLHFEHLFLPCGASNFAGVATSVVSLMVPVAFHVKDWVPIWTGYWMGSSTCVRSAVRKYQNLECERKHSGFEKDWNAPGLGSMSHCVDLPSVKILLQDRIRDPNNWDSMNLCGRSSLKTKLPMVENTQNTKASQSQNWMKILGSMSALANYANYYHSPHELSIV